MRPRSARGARGEERHDLGDAGRGRWHPPPRPDEEPAGSRCTSRPRSRGHPSDTDDVLVFFADEERQVGGGTVPVPGTDRDVECVGLVGGRRRPARRNAGRDGTPARRRGRRGPARCLSGRGTRGAVTGQAKRTRAREGPGRPRGASLDGSPPAAKGLSPSAGPALGRAGQRVRRRGRPGPGRAPASAWTRRACPAGVSRDAALRWRDAAAVAPEPLRAGSPFPRP